MVDADTTVDPLSVNRLISAQVCFLCRYLSRLGYHTRMIHYKKLLRVCGETELANAKQSLITMMQVRLKCLVCHLVLRAF